MISMELIDEINGCYRIKQKNMKTAKIIADISKETLIRYAVFFTIISSESIINYDNLEKTWSKILEHMDSSMLIPKAPEFRDLEIIKGLVSYLENHNMAKEINVDGLLKFDLNALEEIISLVVSLTSEELHGKIIQNLESLC
jgi:glycerol-3-phosphate O-acyltransferase